MTTANQATPIIGTARYDIDLVGFYAESAIWLQGHWARILIATALGLVMIVTLHLIRSFGVRLCARERPGNNGWWKVLGRTLARTGSVFIIIAAIRAVADLADPPLIVITTIRTLFTVAPGKRARDRGRGNRTPPENHGCLPQNSKNLRARNGGRPARSPLAALPVSRATDQPGCRWQFRW